MSRPRRTLGTRRPGATLSCAAGRALLGLGKWKQSAAVELAAEDAAALPLDRARAHLRAAAARAGAA